MGGRGSELALLDARDVVVVDVVMVGLMVCTASSCGCGRGVRVIRHGRSHGRS